MKKILCAHDHRMVEVVDGLFLCECAAYGRLAHMKGAEEEGRRIVERAGGLDKLRDRIEMAELEASQKRLQGRKAAASNRPRPGA